MFTKKLEDQFSADLLNTVRSILGEAKHDKECECEKCEEEEEDEEEDEDEDENGKKKMKEGFASAAQRKAVWATYADGGKGHPDKKKKMKKEDVELEEGQKPYVSAQAGGVGRSAAAHVLDSSGNTVKSFHKKEHGPDYMKKANAYLKKHYNKMMKNEEVELEEGKMKELVTKHMDAGHDYDAAMKKAKKDLEKMKNEEVEQIDELSPRTLGNYVKRRQGDLLGSGMSMAQGDYSKDRMRKTSNAFTGMTRATNKLVKKATKEEVEQIAELSKATMGRYVNKAAERIGSQGVTAGLKIAADEKSKKNFDNMGKRQKGIATAVKKLTKEEQDFIDALNNADIEQIDELSKKTLGSYVNKASTDMYYKGQDTQYHANKANKAGGAFAKQSREKHRGEEEKANRKASNRSTGIERAVSKLTKENVDLEEGRGRPPKEGSAAWKARQKQADDDMVALGMQLRKARSINKKVRFMDGKEHDIHPNHINRFDDHMAARRTSQEKAAFQKQAHKSHADFVKAVSAPVPKSSKDTGEIVKYR